MSQPLTFSRDTPSWPWGLLRDAFMQHLEGQDENQPVHLQGPSPVSLGCLLSRSPRWALKALRAWRRHLKPS